ncbi:MAG: Ig-like domain-containing protein, partial [Patescibacteria group bacterium]
MKKTIVKILIPFLIIGIFFSNIPYYALTGFIDSLVKVQNIVDKDWHLSQNSNIVDKFTSYRHLAEKIKTYEALAASLTYVGGAEASGNSAAYNLSLTSLTGGSGSSPQAGDLVIVATGFVRTSNLNPGVGTAGYTEVADLYGNDTYDANFSVNWKIMGGTPDTSVSCNGSGSTLNGAVCVAHVWRGVNQTTPLDVTSTNTVGTNSPVPNSPAITPITAGAIVIATGLGVGTAGDTSVTAPTGYGNQVDIQVDPSTAATVGIASKAWSGSGAEDPAVWTNWTQGTATYDSWGAVTLAIRPSNDPPSITVSQPDGSGDTVTEGDLYNITYNLTDADSVATVDFYYDTDGSGLNGTAITGCQDQAEGSGATCSWNTTGMTPGSYYVYGIATDGVNPTVSDYSPGQITINAPIVNLTIGATAGSQVTTLNSNDTSQYAQSISCTSAANCSAFTLLLASGSDTLTSIKITETGTVDATNNLANLALFYDTDGNYANGVTGQF